MDEWPPLRELAESSDEWPEPRTHVVFGCCFCGRSDADHGLVLTDMDGGFDQQWWCHTPCLLAAMVEPARSSYAPPEERV